ncbi:flagellar protein FlaG [Shewanella glacialipiscicola]|uniref:Flagellar protein FlaG n=1 Tax=Shewanella glacialipiscicola TaxID=614069 RepID=A0ABQ6J1H8_9GAMM|nr:flagellar protein FlaG [Shewanella glacialipiscicola]MCL1085146.1 flagellar protein FlaG [Shewanella glacialipiscicola]GIU07359.1 hypothetical protein TUM4636_10610 [Shewanella glacialipiscicola]GMA81346.1 hypothetical protein GCM10025855_08790 [Shewanella glacialipiscicola]
MDVNNVSIPAVLNLSLKPTNISTMQHNHPDASMLTITSDKTLIINDVNIVDKVTKTDEATSDELQKAIDDISSNMEMMQKGLAFKIDEESGVQVVKVVDIKTGDLIRQIPNQEALDIARKLSEITGVLMKTEV